MFRKLTATLATLVVAAGISIIAVAAPAEAHTPTYTASCSTLTFKAAAYETRSGNSTPNRAVITIDGVTVLDTTFGTSLGKQTFTYDSTTSHRWTISVDAVGGTNDTQYDWSTQGVTTPCSYPPKDLAVDCSAVTVHWGQALSTNLHVNMRLQTAGGQLAVTAYVDQNVTGGYQGLGLRINGFDPVPLTEQQVKSGLLVFDYPTYVSKSGYDAWAVTWVQVDDMHFNQDETGAWIYCNWSSTVDAVAEVSVTPATCDAGEQLSLGATTHASWGPVQGNYSVVATADAGHYFPAGPGVSADGTTKTFTGSLAGPLDPNGPGCATAVTPVAPTLVTTAGCGTTGSVTPVAVVGVAYATDFDPLSGAYTVRATPQPGYYFPGDADQVIVFSGSVGAYVACSEKPDASLSYGVCVYSADGRAQPREVVITYDNRGSNVPVTFRVTSLPAYDRTVAAGALTTVTITGVGAAGVDYRVTAGAASYSLTVPPCDEPVKPAPITRDVVSEKFSCSPSGVEVTTTTYTIDFVFNPTTVAWEAQPEVAGAPVVTTRALTSAEVSAECGTTVGTDPRAATCSAVNPSDAPGASWIFVAYDPRVVYTFTNTFTGAVTTATSAYTVVPAGPYVVRATAAPGYELQPTAERVWTYVVDDTANCDLPTEAIVVPTLAVTQATCFASATLTLGELSPGTVSWTVNGDPRPVGTYSVPAPATWVVKATPTDPKDGIEAEFLDARTITFTAPPSSCDLVTLPFPDPPLDLPTLAFTGQGPSILGFAAGGTLIALGIGLWLLRRRPEPARVRRH